MKIAVAGTGYVGVGDDFVFFSDGVYSTEFFDGAWQQVMEKSQSVPNLYRLPSYIVEGYDLRFHWDEATGAVGLDTREWETGYVHSSYGMIYAKAEDISYDAAAKTLVPLSSPMHDLDQPPRCGSIPCWSHRGSRTYASLIRAMISRAWFSLLARIAIVLSSLKSAFQVRYRVAIVVFPD